MGNLEVRIRSAPATGRDLVAVLADIPPPTNSVIPRKAPWADRGSKFDPRADDPESRRPRCTQRRCALARPWRPAAFALPAGRLPPGRLLAAVLCAAAGLAACDLWAGRRLALALRVADRRAAEGADFLAVPRLARALVRGVPAPGAAFLAGAFRAGAFRADGAVPADFFAGAAVAGAFRGRAARRARAGGVVPAPAVALERSCSARTPPCGSMM